MHTYICNNNNTKETTNLKLGNGRLNNSDWVDKRSDGSYGILFLLKKLNIIQQSPRNGFGELVTF